MNKARYLFLLVLPLLIVGFFLVFDKVSACMSDADYNKCLDDCADKGGAGGCEAECTNPCNLAGLQKEGGYGLKRAAIAADLNTTGTVSQKIGTFVGALLSLFGIVFFLLAVYSGILWMTARGDSSKVSKAQTILVDAAMGLIIVATSYIITQFIFSAVK